MATTGQNITIHELDKFQVTFTVTDAVNTLAQSLAECWWGVAPAVNSGYSSWVMQKATDGWNTAGAGNESVANHGGLTIGSTTITIEAKLSNDGSHYTGSVNIPNGTYYHECVQPFRDSTRINSYSYWNFNLFRIFIYKSKL